jgi:hypothetical protein
MILAAGRLSSIKNKDAYLDRANGSLYTSPLTKADEAIFDIHFFVWEFTMLWTGATH